MEKIRTADTAAQTVAKILAARRAGYSLGQIGRRLGVTRNKVMRAEMRADGLMEWLSQVESHAASVDVKAMMKGEEPVHKMEG
jgi:hypothetical protein